MNKYFKVLKQLLPRGPFWTIEPGSSFEKLLHAISCEFLRIDEAADTLTRELNPESSTDLIPRWARLFKIKNEATFSEKRDTVLFLLKDNFNSSAHQMSEALKAYGFRVTFQENQITQGSVYAPGWENTFRVIWDRSTYAVNVTDAANSAALSDACARLINVLERFKPAHTHAILVYR